MILYQPENITTQLDIRAKFHLETSELCSWILVYSWSQQTYSLLVHLTSLIQTPSSSILTLVLA